METKTVHIIIHQMEENGEIYYLAESPDLFGLVVEADTLPEIIELAPEVANDLIDTNNKTATPHGKEDILERELIYISFFGEEQFKQMKKNYPFFRFPGGEFTSELISVLKKHGYLPIGRTYTDPSIHPKENSNHLVNEGNKLTNGGIVLLHFNQNGYINIHKTIIGTPGTQGDKGQNPGNLGFIGKEGQQKAVTLSELLNPTTYITPIGRKNIPKNTTIRYTTKQEHPVPAQTTIPSVKEYVKNPNNFLFH